MTTNWFFHQRNSRRDSIGIATLLEPPPSKQRRGSLQLPFREHFFTSKGDNSQNKSAELRALDDPFVSCMPSTTSTLTDLSCVPHPPIVYLCICSGCNDSARCVHLSRVNFFVSPSTGFAVPETQIVVTLETFFTAHSNGLSLSLFLFPFFFFFYFWCRFLTRSTCGAFFSSSILGASFSDDVPNLVFFCFLLLGFLLLLLLLLFYLLIDFTDLKVEPTLNLGFHDFYQLE